MRPKNRRTEALAFLGLAQRAGALVKGTDGVRQALRRKEAFFLILAEDGSRTQREKVLPLAEATEVPWSEFGSMEELGEAVGSGPLAAMALTKAELAKEVRKRLGQVRKDG